MYINSRLKNKNKNLNMKAKFINEDINASYNEGEDDSFIDVTLTEYGEVQIERKIYISEDDIDILESNTIDAPAMDQFICFKLECPFEEDVVIEIEDVRQTGENVKIITSDGEFMTTVYELSELIK